jgi:hypothetical protein
MNGRFLEATLDSRQTAFATIAFSANTGHTFQALAYWKSNQQSRFFASALEHPNCNVRGVGFVL